MGSIVTATSSIGSGSGLVAQGSGYVRLTPSTATTGVQVTFTYTPMSNVYGNAVTFSSPVFPVILESTSAKLTVNNGIPEIGQSFTVSYIVRDSDGQVTPELNFGKFRLEAFNVDSTKLMTCNRDISSGVTGEGTFTCKSTTAGSFTISAYFGSTLLTETTVQVQETQPLNNGNGNMLIVALIGLGIVAVIIILVVIIAFVVWMRRRNKNKDMTELKDEQAEEMDVATVPLKETEV